MILTNQKSNFLYLLLIICIYFFAAYLQAHYLFNTNASSCIHAARQLLAGGNYVNNFYDVNNPIGLFHYIPAILLEKIFGINIMAAVQWYVFTIASISLLACYLFIRHIFSRQETLLGKLFYIALIIMFLIFPQSNLAERDNFLILFTMPYVFLVVYRLQEHSIKPICAFAVGVFAGLGYTIKPQFLIPFCFLEFYYLFYTRKLFGWLRAETIAIFFVLLTGVIITLAFYPEYVTTVMPQAMRYYYQGFAGDPWRLILFRDVVLYVLLVYIFFYIQYKNNPDKILSSVLLLESLGLLLSYIFQHTTWSYHYLPVQSVTILLTILLFNSYTSGFKKPSWINMLVGMVIFSYPIIFSLIFYSNAMYYKKNEEKLINFLSLNTKHKSVYFFATNLVHILPAINYAESDYVSRFSHFAIYPGLINQEKHYSQNSLPIELIQDKQFFTNLVVEDLENKKPEYVFVDVTPYYPYFTSAFPEYLRFFSASKEFKSIWKNYKYVATITESTQNTTNPTDINLYMVHKKEDIILENISGKAAILTGSSNRKTVYFVKNKTYFKNNGHIISHTFHISKYNLKILQNNEKNGLIIKSASSKKIVDKIIKELVIYTDVPDYKYEVYQLMS